MLDRPLFRDRADAGRLLADRLEAYGSRDDVIVVGLPRGGIPVAHEIAKALAVPLDVLVVRKLGVPGHPELAMGAVAGRGELLFDPVLIRRLGIERARIDQVVQGELRELERRETVYREGRDAPRLAGKAVILVDDGLATGATMQVAVRAVRRVGASRIVVAVPVAPEGVGEELKADEFVCAATPEPFLAVGAWYRDFGQTSDDEVRELLELAARPAR